jgi:hypothetical protein
MNIGEIINKATNFGTIKHNDNFISFFMKILFYFIPASILGHYTDLAIIHMQNRKILGNSVLVYIFIQLLIITITLYLLVVIVNDYLYEFQVTIPGCFFIVFYFGLQTNFFVMLKNI